MKKKLFIQTRIPRVLLALIFATLLLEKPFLATAQQIQLKNEVKDIENQSQVTILPITIENHQPKSTYSKKDLQQQATKIQETYDAMQSLRFVFQQQTSGELTGRPQRGSGWAVFFRKAGEQKMRWEYDEPDKQVIVSDGNTLAMYFQKLKQMIVTSAEAMNSDLTYSFFTGRSSLLKDFQITAPDNNYRGDNSTTVLKLIPRFTQQHVKHLHVWADKHHLIRRISIEDHFGTITMLNLSKIKINTLNNINSTKKESMFSFTPPANTEIIQQ